ncbi:MAG: type II toxin-antitoxin system RelE/ParE family toxin [Magnetococcus sp. DMHC-1]|nr:type II toxin-antitoxin system RelE/ParE family toxin [Magnetococcales bacterium]
MAKLTRTKASENDLLSIWQYVAEDNPEAADRLVMTFESKCILLADNPRLGRSRSDIAPGLRYFPVGDYVIFYRETHDGVQVVRILHGARNMDVLFETEYQH